MPASTPVVTRPSKEEICADADRRLKAPREELLLALDGELSPQYRFVGEQLRAHIDFLEQMLAHFEAELLNEMAPTRGR